MEVGSPKSEEKTSGFKQNTMKFKFEKLIIWHKDFGELSRTGIEYAFNLMNMMIAYNGKINLIANRMQKLRSSGFGLPTN